ncbi:RIO1 family regulatory kinase/ATPase [Acidianus ambivalens]|uniref:non-specific serine/threonine protein kinase n=1 Tax=Acidianus ambivalens TaxID=2283 RepID=A0A650CX27_ACIAM|nr:RIO1 family regulatory kinase/ATPase [Acidianus ambivalens]MQL54594.1 serine/threonine protein kinase [Acidianus ambivalens]QGR22401.1 serine/threonine protein kinase [Acidianus ambivalens]
MPSLTLAEKASLVLPEDYLVLKTFVELKDKYEYLTEEELKDRLNFTDTELRISLEKLRNLRAVSWDIITGKRAYKITFTGLDILAIKMLYVNKILNRLGLIIGEGKESNVYYGYDFDNNTIIVKFHRVGNSSYKNARKLRGYRGKRSWISITLDNAKNEYIALKCLSENLAKVPKPLGYAYNAVAMEYIEGPSLLKAELNKPKEVLDSIIGSLRIAYLYCNKMVHGDLSPYNIIIGDNESPYIIDWPQWRQDDDNLLNRDVNNIISFFSKKYNITEDLNYVMAFIKGKA